MRQIYIGGFNYRPSAVVVRAEWLSTMSYEANFEVHQHDWAVYPGVILDLGLLLNEVMPPGVTAKQVIVYQDLEIGGGAGEYTALRLSPLTDGRAVEFVWTSQKVRYVDWGQQMRIVAAPARRVAGFKKIRYCPQIMFQSPGLVRTNMFFEDGS